MEELIIICTPNDIYKGKTEQDIARTYTQMTILDWEKLISINASYKPLKGNEITVKSILRKKDYSLLMNKKKGRDIILTAFLNTPYTKVGDVSGTFVASSYLFNLEFRNLLLPDIDFIQISGESRVRDAAFEIERFYQGYGWNTDVISSKDIKTLKVSPVSDRFNDEVEIVDPEVLIGIAKKKVKYSLKNLCF